MIFKGSQAAESDIVKVTEGNARFLSFELGRKTSILLGVLIVVVSFLCTAQAQTEEKIGTDTKALRMGRNGYGRLVVPAGYPLNLLFWPSVT